MKPEISIVIPAYNVEKYITATLDSIYAQTFKDYEIIIINDASSDKTEEVIFKYISSHEFKYAPLYLKNESNIGCCSSRNRGIRAARSRYICFLDADDEYHKDFLNCMYDEIVRTKSDFVFCGYDIQDTIKDCTIKYTDKRIYPVSANRLHIIYKYMTGALHIGHWAAIYDINFLRSNSILYFDGCQKAGDTEFVLNALMCSKKISFVPKSLYIYKLRPCSITTSKPSEKMFDGYFAYKRVFKKIRNPLIKILYYFTKYPRETHIILQAFYEHKTSLPYLYISKYKILWFSSLNIFINKKKDAKKILLWFYKYHFKIK